MIIAPKFYGDENTTVMYVQEHEYGRIIRMFVSRAIEKYRYAEGLLGEHTEIGNKLPRLLSFKISLDDRVVQESHDLIDHRVVQESHDLIDHRIVQESHDLIAALFRFREYPHGSLFKEEVDIDDCIRRWYDFASREIEELLEMPYFARAMILAIAEHNSEIGSENEKTMLEVLKRQYGEMLQTKPPNG